MLIRREGSMAEVCPQCQSETTAGGNPRLETIAYAWGCGQPSLPLFRNYSSPKEAAQRVAIAHGWDAARAGAWATEIVLPARRDLALLALAAEARRDTAVEG